MVRNGALLHSHDIGEEWSIKPLHSSKSRYRFIHSIVAGYCRLKRRRLHCRERANSNFPFLDNRFAKLVT
jgi:hypothetical protein